MSELRDSATWKSADNEDITLSPSFRRAIASLRLEGLEPTPYALELFRQASAGDLTTEEVRAHLLAYYRDRTRRAVASDR